MLWQYEIILWLKRLTGFLQHRIIIRNNLFYCKQLGSGGSQLAGLFYCWASNHSPDMFGGMPGFNRIPRFLLEAQWGFFVLAAECRSFSGISLSLLGHSSLGAGLVLRVDDLREGGRSWYSATLFLILSSLFTLLSGMIVFVLVRNDSDWHCNIQNAFLRR